MSNSKSGAFEARNQRSGYSDCCGSSCGAGGCSSESGCSSEGGGERGGEGGPRADQQRTGDYVGGWEHWFQRPTEALQHAPSAPGATA